MVPARAEGPSPGFIAVLRFRPDNDAALLDELREALPVITAQAGFVDARIARSLDDHLIMLTLGWESVGAYRRALSAYDVKVAVVPLLAQAVDEATAFEVLHERDAAGVREATSSRAADADTVSLGHAASGFVPPAAS